VTDPHLVCHDPSVTRTVLVVDDHEGFRGWARRCLEAAGHVVVGEAADGGTAIEAAGRLRPEVVLLDVSLPDMDGFAVADRLADESTVVLVSSREAADYEPRVQQSRAAGFISKADLSAGALAAVLRSKGS
jgi:DNA-binding NarL/FixJ family response regulator